MFEIRAKGEEGIGRAFFCALMGRRIVILHDFIKKTRQTPAKELKTARIEDRYQPVAFSPKAHAAKKRKEDPEFRAAYDALEDEFAALGALLHARKDAGLTQADVAARMGVSQPVLARIESSLGSRKHSPSLATLRKYADACGKKLVIRMV
ncbi:MAG: XRE family transcriptional regulator [Sulfuritalea sp.]|nr:XRE family transcriptional regulator [Sulfuritalea sp.]